MKHVCLIFILGLLNLISLAQSSRNASETSTDPQALNERIPNHNELPIKPARTISFTTDEASCMDVDISPDGQTILFSFLGNLYSLPSKGGTAIQLTRGLAINRSPVWSPDGKFIAYESDATGFIGVHVFDKNGKFHKTFGEGRYEERLNLFWLPDSKHVVVDNDVYHVTGISSSLPKNIGALISFSDNKFIYCLEPISRDSSAIIKFNRENREKHRILVLNKPYGHLNNARISPNGNWLTFIKYEWLGSCYSPADSLIAINLKTGEEKLLAHLETRFTGYLGQQHFSFSKDSKFLFIGYKGKIHKIEIETGKNEIIPFTAHVNVDMGPLNYNTFKVPLDSLEVKYIRSAQRSPDGKQLTFSALNRIYIMDLPHGKPRILADQSVNQFQPTYSPDGKWITYVSWSDSTGGHVWRVPSHGGNFEQITNAGGLYQHPSWSSDGKMIIVAKGKNKLGRRDNPGEGQIEVINLQDKLVKVYADTIPLFNQPVFSSDGKKIMFKPNQRGGDNKIWPRMLSIELETKTKNILAYAVNEGESFSPLRQIILSPDNRYIVFMYNGDLHLVPMAYIGSPEMIFNKIEQKTMIRFARGGIDANWEEEGKVLSWVNGNRYCRINPDKIIKAAQQVLPNKTLTGLPQTKIIDVDIPADQSIAIHLKVPRNYAKGIIALRNARIITMHGNDVIESGTIVIKDGRLVSIGKTEGINVPKEARVFDLNGKTIIPGFIDMHSHMYEAVPPDVFLQQSWQRLINLSYGVTTARDPSGSFDTFGYGELVESGQMIGPRLFTVGHAVRPNFNLTSLNEAKVVVGKSGKMGATVIKQYAQKTRLQRQLLLSACKDVGLNMTNEVEKDPLYCIGMIKDGSTGVEHNPVWGEVYKDIIMLVAKSGTFLTPTLQACYGKDEGKKYFRKLYGQEFLNRSSNFITENDKKEFLKDINENKIDSGFLDQSRINTAIKRAGGKIVMGSHGEDQGIGAHWEIWALQMGGLTNMEALQTATITAAEGLGIQKDLGSIEVGKIADLIILDKNPLEDIHNTTSIKYVMKAGVLYESETLDELWPEKKKCPEWRMKN